VVAGGVAGVALVLLDATLGDELERIDSGAAALAAVGLALTLQSIGRDESARRTVGDYWVIVAVASVPVVTQFWLRRRRCGVGARNELRRLARHIAGRDYRGDGGNSSQSQGH
jgi:hypothetical protein